MNETQQGSRSCGAGFTLFTCCSLSYYAKTKAAVDSELHVLRSQRLSFPSVFSMLWTQLHRFKHAGFVRVCLAPQHLQLCRCFLICCKSHCLLDIKRVSFQEERGIIGQQPWRLLQNNISVRFSQILSPLFSSHVVPTRLAWIFHPVSGRRPQQTSYVWKDSYTLTHTSIEFLRYIQWKEKVSEPLGLRWRSDHIIWKCRKPQSSKRFPYFLPLYSCTPLHSDASST